MGLKPFHLAVTVHDLAAARTFYGGLLGCPEGRSASTWVDFNFYGHQFVCHHSDSMEISALSSRVDGKTVPVPHFGIVLDWPDWEALVSRLNAAAIQFLVDPCIRFAGHPGEQATFFIADPSGNVLEFKAMRDMDRLFATD